MAPRHGKLSGRTHSLEPGIFHGALFAVAAPPEPWGQAALMTSNDGGADVARNRERERLVLPPV